MVALLFDGVKLRALFVVPDAHDRTVFYGLNFAPAITV